MLLLMMVIVETAEMVIVGVRVGMSMVELMERAAVWTEGWV
jgi:hypothetical protein